MLHLAAFDAEDLAAISAQMQDAVIRLGDISYQPKRRQLALIANRFAWDSLPNAERRRTGLRINAVISAKRQMPAGLGPDTILSLLAFSFEEDDTDPEGLSGTLTLAFSGGHKIALALECIDIQLDDLGPVWGALREPKHEN